MASFAWRLAEGWTRAGVACLVALAACGTAPPVTPAVAIPAAPDDCGLDAARGLEAEGLLDAALAALSRCAAPPSSVLAERMEILVHLGDVDDAKLLAARLAADPSRAARAAEIAAMTAPEGRLADARAFAQAGVAARGRSDPVVAARKLSMARHLYRRIAGAEPEPAFLSGASVLGWAGDVPLWRLAARPFPIDEASPPGSIAIGVVDRDAGEVEITHLLAASDAARPWASWPGHPGALVVSTKSGLAILGVPGAPRRLDARGTPSFSPRGDVLVVATGTALVGYETATWTRVFDLQANAQGGGSWLRDGSLYAEVGEGALVVDVPARRVILDQQDVTAALSASNAYLAVLAIAEGRGQRAWSLDLRAADALDKPRRVFLDVSFIGPPTLEFVGDRRLVVGEHLPVAHGDYVEVERAVVDVASGSVRRGAGKAPGLPHYARIAQEAYTKLTRTMGALVQKPRALVPAGQFSSPFETGRRTSVIAATAGTLGPGCKQGLESCFLPDASVILGDARSKSLLHEVKIPVAGFSMTILTFTPDEASVFACGIDEKTATHGFVIDVASGRIAAAPATNCVDWKLDEKGALVLLEGGVVDLERRPGRPWPEAFPLRVAPRDAPKALRGAAALPEGTPGLVCRFGDVVAPFAVCPAPSR